MFRQSPHYDTPTTIQRRRSGENHTYSLVRKMWQPSVLKTSRTKFASTAVAIYLVYLDTCAFLYTAWSRFSNKTGKALLRWDPPCWRRVSTKTWKCGGTGLELGPARALIAVCFDWGALSSRGVGKGSGACGWMGWWDDFFDEMASSFRKGLFSLSVLLSLPMLTGSGVVGMDDGTSILAEGCVLEESPSAVGGSSGNLGVNGDEGAMYDGASILGEGCVLKESPCAVGGSSSNLGVNGDASSVIGNCCCFPFAILPKPLLSRGDTGECIAFIAGGAESDLTWHAGWGWEWLSPSPNMPLFDTLGDGDEAPEFPKMLNLSEWEKTGFWRPLAVGIPLSSTTGGSVSWGFDKKLVFG